MTATASISPRPINATTTMVDATSLTDVTDNTTTSPWPGRFNDVTDNTTTSPWPGGFTDVADNTTTSPWPGGFTDVTDNTMTSPWPGRFNDTGTQAVTPPEGCLVIPFSTFSLWSHPEDLVTKDAQELFNRIVNVYLLTLLFFVAVPTNIVNMVIYWRQGLKERINLCLFCLSFADFVTVFAHFEWNLDGLYAEITGRPKQLVVIKFNVNNMIHSLAAFIYISGFLSLLIAFERFLCVVYPLKAHVLVRTRTTLVVIVVGHVLILLGHYIIATRWHVECLFDPQIAQTIDAFYPGEFYLENKELVDTFESVVFGILLPGICVVGVSVFTIIIVAKLRQRAEWRSQSSANTSNVKDVTLTRTLIGASVLYLVCTTPPLVFHTLMPAVPDLSLEGKYYNTYTLLINVHQLLTYVNASVNFFIYYIFGTKFRCGVKKLFRCRGVRSEDAARRRVEENSTVAHSSGAKVTALSLSSSEQVCFSIADAGSSNSAGLKFK